MSGLIWVQTVCKGYQQTTLGGKDFNLHLGDNCAQNFHLGRYIIGYTGIYLVLWQHMRQNYRYHSLNLLAFKYYTKILLEN